MKVLVAVKVVFDSEDIAVKSDRSLDFSKAKAKISEYDTNAIEVASTLGAESVKVISVGDKLLNDSKVKKNILSRGVDELLFASNDAYQNLEAHQTAKLLAELAKKAEYDLIILGDGSADNMAQQVDVQLACELGVPVVTAVSKIEVLGDSLKLERILDNSTQEVKVSLPAVISVVPDIAQPRIPGMKDILAAGKKPSEEIELSTDGSCSVEELSNLAPEQVDRAQNIEEASDDAIAKFAEALKSRL